MVCMSYTYPAGSEGLVVLAVMDCWRERFNIRLTGITGLKLGLGLQGRGNALVENGKKRNDRIDNAELWKCVWDIECKRRYIAHVMLTGKKENSLGNISTEESGPLRSQCRENDPITFIKMSIRHLKLLLCVYVSWGATAFVCLRVKLTLLCVCVAIFHGLERKSKVFLRFPHSQIACVFLKKWAGIRWVNMSTVYNYSPVSSKIQQIIAVDDSPMNHCIQKTRRLSG